ISPLQELTANVLAEDTHLFAIQPTIQRVTWSLGANDYLFGQRHLQTPNDPDGMAIYYYLKDAGSGPVTITVRDSAGKEVGRLIGPSAAGVNRVVWNTRVGGGGRGGRGGGGGRGASAGANAEVEGAPGRGEAANPLDQWMPLGDYKVTLDV